MQLNKSGVQIMFKQQKKHELTAESPKRADKQMVLACYICYKQQKIFRTSFDPTLQASRHPDLSTPMGVDYAVIGFDMEVQPLVTHNAA